MSGIAQGRSGLRIALPFIALAMIFLFFSLSGGPLKTLVGVAVFLGALAFFALRGFAGRLNMKANRTELSRGETVSVEVEVPQNTRNLQVLIRAEEMYETGGKHGHLYRETAYEEKKPMSGSSGGKITHTFEIPKSAPPSIGPYAGSIGDYVKSVGLRWYIYAKADLPNALDKEGRIELRVK
jgi:hypothetical protein